MSIASSIEPPRTAHDGASGAVSSAPMDEPPMGGARVGPHEGALARLASRCSCSFHRSRSICSRFMDGPVEAFTRASLSAEYWAMQASLNAFHALRSWRA